jgi:hypothetical protein
MRTIVSLARQTRLVFGRSLRAGLREPALAFVFPIAFPLLIIGLFSHPWGRALSRGTEGPARWWACGW